MTGDDRRGAVGNGLSRGDGEIRADANASGGRSASGLTRSDRGATIREVEFSINSRCSLACEHCGFLVPHQREPQEEPPANALDRALRILQDAHVTIESLALLGGEATLAPVDLDATVAVANAAPNVGRVELVTNGLTPQGLRATALRGLWRVSLSDYTADEELATAWRVHLARRAPWIELVVRRHETWDPMDDAVDLGPEGGQRAFDGCWYRRHCVTLERGRLFPCSRMAKLAYDAQSLPLAPRLSLSAVASYLDRSDAHEACRTCTPMAGLPTVAPGRQPDDRIDRLRARALSWFTAAMEER